MIGLYNLLHAMKLAMYKHLRSLQQEEFVLIRLLFSSMKGKLWRTFNVTLHLML